MLGGAKLKINWQKFKKIIKFMTFNGKYCLNLQHKFWKLEFAESKLPNEDELLV